MRQKGTPDYHRDACLFYATIMGSIHEQCARYNVSGVEFYPGSNSSVFDETLKCDAGWEYDLSQYESTIITDVSNRNFFHPFPTSFRMLISKN